MTTSNLDRITAIDNAISSLEAIIASYRYEVKAIQAERAKRSAEIASDLAAARVAFETEPTDDLMVVVEVAERLLASAGSYRAAEEAAADLNRVKAEARLSTLREELAELEARELHAFKRREARRAWKAELVALRERAKAREAEAQKAAEAEAKEKAKKAAFDKAKADKRAKANPIKSQATDARPRDIRPVDVVTREAVAIRAKVEVARGECAKVATHADRAELARTEYHTRCAKVDAVAKKAALQTGYAVADIRRMMLPDYAQILQRIERGAAQKQAELNGLLGRLNQVEAELAEARALKQAEAKAVLALVGDDEFEALIQEHGLNFPMPKDDRKLRALRERLMAEVQR